MHWTVAVVIAWAACSVAAAILGSQSHARDVGSFGGTGGGEFRITCEPGDFLVGFDVIHTHVIDRIAPVCGDARKGGTYGRPWIGGVPKLATRRDRKERCQPGALLTILHVFADRIPLVNRVGFTCWHPGTGDVTNNLGGVAGNNRRLICPHGEVATGIYGRAGTAIDRLGLICERFERGLTADGSPNRGLLASAPFTGQPMKGVYFFPGESRDHQIDTIYTAIPTVECDKRWLSGRGGCSRSAVIERIIAANANVIVLSYWSNMPHFSPMEPGLTPVEDVIAAVKEVKRSTGKRILIMPAIESGYDEKNPGLPHFEFHKDFLSGGSLDDPENLAPGLLLRIRELIGAFAGNMDKWAQLYDRNGQPRYAIHIVHAYADRVPAYRRLSADQVFALGFQRVADLIEKEHKNKLSIGFTLDLLPAGKKPGNYAALFREAGRPLALTPAVLAVQGFASEFWSPKVKWAPIGAPPVNNNTGGYLYAIVDWKAEAVRDWVSTGLPVIYDVSSGFDGRFVWKDKAGLAFWGDNYDGTDDRWRNALSQLKGNGIKGITFNTWNGFTEGYAAVPTIPHGDTIYNWLRDLYAADPRECSHMHYGRGRATFRVRGAICEAWVRLGGDRGFLGIPTSNELQTKHGRVSHFAAGSIYWSVSTGAHAVHGLIADAYKRAGADASCLKLPVTDEGLNGPRGRISRFQGGVITWKQGDAQAKVQCH